MKKSPKYGDEGKKESDGGMERHVGKDLAKVLGHLDKIYLEIRLVIFGADHRSVPHSLSARWTSGENGGPQTARATRTRTARRTNRRVRLGRAG